jgi:hypothetical protein
LRIPDRRFEYVTCRPLLFSNFLILSFTLPMLENSRAESAPLNVTTLANYDRIRWNPDGECVCYRRRSRAWEHVTIQSLDREQQARCKQERKILPCLV